MLESEGVEKLVQYWLEGSEKDLKSAENIFEFAGEYAASLFFAHLAVEKALKAQLVKVTKLHAPFTHNLIHLIQKLNWVPDLDIETKLSEINDFNLQGRYPDEKGEFRLKATQEFCNLKLKDVKEVLKWILLKSNPES